MARHLVPRARRLRRRTNCSIDHYLSYTNFPPHQPISHDLGFGVRRVYRILVFGFKKEVQEVCPIVQCPLFFITIPFFDEGGGACVVWPRVNKDVMRESVAAVRGQSRSQQPIPFLDPLWNVGHREVSLYWCPFRTLEVGYVAARSWTALIIIGIVDSLVPTIILLFLFSSFSLSFFPQMDFWYRISRGKSLYLFIHTGDVCIILFQHSS